MTWQSLLLDEQMDYSHKILKAKNEGDIRAHIAGFARALGFDNFVYTASNAAIGTLSESGRHRYIHDFSGAWGIWAETGRFPWGEGVGEEAVKTIHRVPPLVWNSLGHNNLESVPVAAIKRAKRRHRLAGEFGQHSGITIPLHMPNTAWSLISFMAGSRAHKPELMPRLLSAYYFANCLQFAIAHLSIEQASRAPRLSQRECEVLRWSAVGKTSWEIARILRISERTVNYHLYRAAAKFGVKGRHAATAQAIAQGLITL